MRGEEAGEVEEGVPWEEVVEEGVALGEGEAEEVGVPPEALIHGKWGSVLVRINIHANLTAVSSYTQKHKLTTTQYRDRLHNLLDSWPTVILFHSSSGSAIRQFLVTS